MQNAECKMQNGRLIDANALITTIQGTESKVARTAPYNADWFTRLAVRQFEIIEMIADAPIVDAVEVVHGRWRRRKYDEDSPVQCSKCLMTFSYIDGMCYLVSETELPYYCPNCGAKMDGERRNDEQEQI